ncbi:sulfatase-like hydrolase/transferase [Porifericola rhodea]|uniref:sulfatase-like hydrolase/transferase n=1 Tax=Porifericola rhodea TaxID=930972 RepID=UPI0026663BBA|nr:sulfatase-like hydrolase/transferase [Porifericola rhodea]WKN30349.1 sulfatase-like hydrolase/transferase [Porifericola rhodea]
MKNTTNLSVLLFSLVLSACHSEAQPTEKTKPNILLMVADDMGYADLNCYGGLSNTPHLNQLAKEGIRLTNFYAAASNCSPSRAGLLTGKSPARLGMYSYRPQGHPMHLRTSEVTIAEALQEENYQTAHIGKWHLGCLPQDTAFHHPQPHDQGFSYSLGTENNAQPSHLNPVNFVRNGEQLDAQEGYSCNILANEALSWFEQQWNQEDPFFMYMAFHEPHAKIASPPELVEKYKSHGERDAEYLANIENLDLAVGKVVDYLRAQGLLDNTLLIFSSDNGSYRQASNGQLRAVKSYLYEGGIRVPGIIRWPELIQGGQEVHEAAGFVDVLPTLADLLNLKSLDTQNLDGTSILPLLKGENFERENPLYWFFYRTSPEIAMRIGDMMVMGKDKDTVARTHPFTMADMEYVKEVQLHEYELYQLTEDDAQYHNLAGRHPEAEVYQQKLNNKLRKIKEEAYYWEKLPEAEGNRKPKTEWVKYKRIEEN